MNAVPVLVRNILWWLPCGAVCLWLQIRLPGVDAFVPVILLCLQEKRWKATIWLCLFCICMHEGTGTLSFGTAVLWYGGLLGLYFAGRVVFVVNSLFFVVLFSLAAGALYMLIMLSLPPLQYVPVSSDWLLGQSLAHILLIPPAWGIARLMRGRIFPDEAGV